MSADLQGQIAQLRAVIKQRDERDSALRQLREAVWLMKEGDDLHIVVAAVGVALEQGGVDHFEFGVNVFTMKPEGTDLSQWIHRDAGRIHRTFPVPDDHSLISVWRAGFPVYRPDLLADDPFGELEDWAEDEMGTRRSIVDVPFSRGTLAVNSLHAAAFSETDQAFLQQIANVLSEALQRWLDLGRLREQTVELERRLDEADERESELQAANDVLAERERLLGAFRGTSQALLTSLDPEHILDTLSRQVVEAGVFRSLTVSLVDYNDRRVRVVRAYSSPISQADAAVLRKAERILGLEYDLDDDNINACVARSGQMEVIQGWDDRYDSSLKDTTSIASTAYFIPVLHHERVVAVLATGSYPDERDAVLERIEALRPFFDEVAIALQIARLYADLQERERELRQLQKMEVMGELTAGIAHNFNNLLQAVSGNLELALEESDGVVSERIDAALRVVHSQAELVRQLMSYSQRNLPYEEAVEPTSVMDAVVGICRMTFDRRIQLHTEVADDLPSFQGNGPQLEQAVLNLCVNARDAVADSDDPQICLGARVEGDDTPELVITVRDNGVGMTGAVRERIFDPFFTTKDVGSGTGLGLSIVHGIVRQHHGRIECASDVGRGTCFELYLPLIEAIQKAPTSVSAGDNPGGDETILVVDDEEAVRTTVAIALRRLGYRVLEAIDGDECLALLQRDVEQIDLLLLDMSMPNVSGAEVIERLEAETAPPVILFTGYANTPDDIRREVAAILEKPLATRVLSETVRTVLDGA